MAITVDMIKELREKTGSGMMDCKKALTEADGDMEKAVKWLREKGIATAEKKSSRIAAEGIVESYIHAGGRVGVLIEVNIETDFAAKNEDFRRFVKDLGMQVAAMNPQWVSKEEVPAEALEKEREIVRNQALNEGKPEKIVDKIVEGRLSKFYDENCLLEQSYVKDDSKKIKDVLTQMIATIGENITIRRFTRYEMGEGLQKREENFADEVMKQIK
ncbi:MAG: elongation factor Ts [Clostridiales bacterium]|jgi:elongation factor Ts|nr:translation elongation factor Ts [Eubacteriales bacterium]MDD3197210.1 translation elongation factor Ts [Eubacteriales bacterium]MDD3502559.1 translation elongation factor Ts [Eubacteriales bacterium]MDD4681681.1 translation elongation factor Ts [Eubacteriales bacterium]MDN5313887.1 elongation factor Ts [Clostridiales bacterium]